MKGRCYVFMNLNDFKFQELQEKLKNGGYKVLFTGIGLQFLLGIITTIIILITVGGNIVSILSGNLDSIGNLIVSGFGSIMVGVLLVLGITFVGGLFINSGIISSYKKLLETGDSGNFFENAKENIKRFILYYIIALVANSILTGIIVGILPNQLGILVAHLITGLPLFIYPIMYLSLYEGNVFENYTNFIKEKAKILGIIAAGYFVISYLPLGDLIIIISNLLLPLYILILYNSSSIDFIYVEHPQKDEPINEVKEDENITEENTEDEDNNSPNIEI